MTRPSKRNRKTGETIASYKVGKGKPPLGSRWQEGCESPNPKGRPPKPKVGSRDLNYFLNQKHEFTGPDGEKVVMTRREIGYDQLAKRFAKAENAAVRVVLAHDSAAKGKDADPFAFDPDLAKELIDEYLADPKVGADRKRAPPKSRRRRGSTSPRRRGAPS